MPQNGEQRKTTSSKTTSGVDKGETQRNRESTAKGGQLQPICHL